MMLFKKPQRPTPTEELLQDDEFTAMEMELCKKAIEQGICRYENRFKKPKDIPFYRARDATNIRSLLARKYEAVEDLLDVIDSHLATFKTGWILWGYEIISSQRSKLKTDIKDAMGLFRDAREISNGYRMAAQHHSGSESKSRPVFIPLNLDDYSSEESVRGIGKAQTLHEFREYAQKRYALNSYSHFSNSFTRKELLINAQRVMEGDTTLPIGSAPAGYFAKISL